MKIRSLYYIIMALAFPMAFSSCEDYLDKAVDAEITEDDVFRKFVTFQGFAEDMYQCVVDIANRDVHGMNNWNWGDEFLPGIHTERMGTFDNNGDYWYGITQTDHSVFMGNSEYRFWGMELSSRTRLLELWLVGNTKSQYVFGET